MDPALACKRYAQLESQRKNLDNVLQNVQELVVPYRAEFFKDMGSETEVQWRRRGIWSSTAPQACKLLASHMHGSLTTPATPWFGLKYRDQDLNTNQASAEWLEDSETRLWQEILESDFNAEAPEIYLDLASFGTAMFMCEPKVDTVLPEEWDGFDFTCLPIMDSYFEEDINGRPMRFYRRLRLTDIQLRDRFDYDPGEASTPDEDGTVDEKQDVIFCVYYRDGVDRDAQGPLAPDKRPVGYKYIHRKTKEVLEEGGYYEYPIMVIRYAKTAGSVWGHSPAMVMLSDIRMLNETVAQVVEARAKVIDPPIKTTETGVVGDMDLQPGGLTVVTDMDELEPFLIMSDFPQADAEIMRLESAIREGFFIPQLELKLSPAMTATEVNARQQRMMRFMAPTVGRLQNDFLNPLIEMMFQAMLRMDQFDEMPEDLEDVDLDIEYTGPIPRAQKEETAQGMIEWLMTIAQVAEVFPQAADIPDLDYCVRELGKLKGVPAEGSRQQQEVEVERKQKAEAMQEMQQTEQDIAEGEADQATGLGQQALAAVPGGPGPGGMPGGGMPGP